MVMELMQDGSVLAAFRGRDVQQPANLLLAASVAEQVGGRGPLGWKIKFGLGVKVGLSCLTRSWPLTLVLLLLLLPGGLGPGLPAL